MLIGVSMLLSRFSARERCLRCFCSSGRQLVGTRFDQAQVVVLVVADAAGLVGQRPGRLDVDLHVGDHFGHGRQRLDRPAELLPRVGVGARQPIGGLGDPQRLGGDAHAGPVHQGQHVGDQAPLPLADQPGRRVLVDQLAGGRAVDAQLVLQVPDLDLLATARR